jgi:flagellar hook-associated protein 3 FlgL
MTRVTQRGIALTSLQGLNRNLAEVSRLQQQLSSGKVLTRPSDSPTGTNRAMQARSEQAANAQFARNISDGQSWMATTDSTLTTMLEQTRRVRDLTVQALNGGATSAASRSALAEEVGQIRQSLLGLANTTVGNRPVFGGATASSTAYDISTGAYVGRGGTATEAAAEITRRISRSATVRVDTTGAEAFGDPTQGDDLFATVDKIASGIASGSGSLSAQLTALDAALGRMTAAVSDVGARAARLDAAAQTVTDRSLSLKGELAAVEDVDLPQTIMELQMHQTGYQAALSATAKVITPSLVEFLR